MSVFNESNDNTFDPAESADDNILTYNPVSQIISYSDLKPSQIATIAYVDGEIQDQTARIDAVFNNVIQLETDVAGHETRLDIAEGDISFLQSDLATVEGQLATAQTDIINIENTYLPKTGGIIGGSVSADKLTVALADGTPSFNVNTTNNITTISDLNNIHVNLLKINNYGYSQANKACIFGPYHNINIDDGVSGGVFINPESITMAGNDGFQCSGANSSTKFSVITAAGLYVIRADTYNYNGRVIIGHDNGYANESYSLPSVRGVSGQVLTSNGATTVWSDVSASMSNYLLLTGGTLTGTLNGTIFNGNSLQLKNNGFKTTITASNYDEDCSFIFPNNQITAQNGWVLKLNNTATGETIWGLNTLQSIYDSATAQIVTSNARGALTIKNGQSLSSDKQLVINNAFDENTFSVSNDSILLKSYTGPTIVVSSATVLFHQRSGGENVPPQVQFRLASNYNGNISGFCSAFNSISGTGFSSLNLSYNEVTRKFSLFLGYSSYSPNCIIEYFTTEFLDITKLPFTRYNYWIPPPDAVYIPYYSSNVTYLSLSPVTGYTANNTASLSTTASSLPNLTTTALVATSISGTSLTIGGTLITSTPTEINKLNGMTMSTAQLNSIPNLAPLANPSFTGSPRCPNPDVADESDRVANCSFVNTKLVSYAKLLSPQLTGAPTCPTPFAVDNSTRLATTAFVKGSFLDTTFTGTTTINKMKLLNYPKLPAWDMTGYDKDSVSAYFLEKCQPNAPLRTLYLASFSPAGGLNACYAPYLGRYYIGPDTHANQANWWYWNCSTKAFVSYAHGIAGLAAGAYRTICYHAHLNRLYFIPHTIGTTWHYIDGITGALVSYTGVSVVGGAYGFGVYSPIEKRIYFIPTNQANQTNYHYISDTGAVVAYTPSLKTPSNYDATYDSLNNRIMISPHQNAHLSVWYYIDCSGGVADNAKVKSYAHGMTGVSDTSTYGCCFHPILNRIYFLPWAQSTVCYYWDCNTLTISSYNYGQTGGANYIHGIYMPTIGAIVLVPYNKGTQDIWKMIDYQGNVKDVVDTTIWNSIFRTGFYDVENDIGIMMPDAVNAYIQLQPLTSARIDKYIMASSMMGN